MSTTTQPKEKEEPVVLPVDLRDYFAAKAMQGIICTPDVQLHEEWPTHRHRAEFAYEMADAMLKAREVQP